MPEIIMNEGHSAYINSIEYTNDGKYVLSSAKNEVKVWDAKSGNLIKTFKSIDFPYDTLYPWNCSSPVFSPTGEYFAYYSESSKAVILYDILSGKKTSLLAFERKIYDDSSNSLLDGAVEFSRDGKYIAVTEDKSIIVYSLKDLEKKFIFEGFDCYTCVLFSFDSSVIIGVRNSAIDVWDMASKNIVDTIHNAKVEARAIALSHDNRFIVFYTHEPSPNIFTLSFSIFLGE